MNFETWSSIFTSTNIADKRLRTGCWYWWFLRGWNTTPAHLLMLDKSFWIESTTTACTSFEHIIVEMPWSSFIISLHFALCLRGTAFDLGELLRWLRKWLSLTGRLLCFPFLPFFLASFEMDLEAGSSELPPTYVAHKGFWSLYNLGRCKTTAALKTTWGASCRTLDWVRGSCCGCSLRGIRVWVLYTIFLYAHNLMAHKSIRVKCTPTPLAHL